MGEEGHDIFQPVGLQLSSDPRNRRSNRVRLGWSRLSCEFVNHRNTHQTKPSRLAKKRQTLSFMFGLKIQTDVKRWKIEVQRSPRATGFCTNLGCLGMERACCMQAGRSLHLAGCYSVMHVFSSQVSLEQLAAFLAPAAHRTSTISCGHGMDPSQLPCGILDQKGTATIIQYTKSTCIIAESNHCLRQR